MNGNHQRAWRLQHSYAELPAICHQAVSPTPVSRPRLTLFNEPLAQELGLPANIPEESDWAAWGSGNRIPPGSRPLAQAYAGHQFGGFTILGDGRAILIGEQLTPRGQIVDVQWKGCGRTPYSRQGDGRAALGPMLREFLISEAMAGLKIPTSRSLCVVETGEGVRREQVLRGAVLTRVAASHIRVGTFEFLAYHRDQTALIALMTYAIQRHYPHLMLEAETAETPLVWRFLEAVMERQISLVVEWMSVGFIHGVLNTDNISIAGETIDYGPCAFMNAYHPGTVFSSIDDHGRYAYGNQPRIMYWNLARLAEALLGTFGEPAPAEVEQATALIKSFPDRYEQAWRRRQNQKLGWAGIHTPEDRELADELLQLLTRHSLDYTLTYRVLAGDTHMDTQAWWRNEEFCRWESRWQQRVLLGEDEDRPEAAALAQCRTAAQQTVDPVERRRAVQKLAALRTLGLNPVVIPRNHWVERALHEVVRQDDLNLFNRLWNVVRQPWEWTPEHAEFTLPPPAGDHNYQTFCGT